MRRHACTSDGWPCMHHFLSAVQRQLVFIVSQKLCRPVSRHVFCRRQPNCTWISELSKSYSRLSKCPLHRPEQQFGWCPLSKARQRAGRALTASHAYSKAVGIESFIRSNRTHAEIFQPKYQAIHERSLFPNKNQDGMISTVIRQAGFLAVLRWSYISVRLFASVRRAPRQNTCCW